MCFVWKSIDNKAEREGERKNARERERERERESERERKRNKERYPFHLVTHRLDPGMAGWTGLDVQNQI